jgi:uncharacterized repeat protein (TIGR01451 family)
MNFLNGPVKYIPIDNIMDDCAEILPDNLIRDADYGTMGTFPAGTTANTGPVVSPYPENVPDFDYVLPLSHPVHTPTFPPWFHAPEDGEYTVQNILNDDNSNRIGAWWRIADHTVGNETGRFMLVNGDEPGSVFFTTTVDISPNTHYLFSAWILNVFKVIRADVELPALGFRITGNNTGILYNSSLGVEIPTRTEVPEWKQIGTDIFTGNNTIITIEFLSEGEEDIGNDYAVDDVELAELEVPLFVPVKSVNTNEAVVGEIVTYTITLDNDCSNPLLGIMFTDVLASGLTFVPGSVTVDGVSLPLLDPSIGIRADELIGGSEIVITFEAEVTSIPADNPIPNTATVSYEYTPVTGGIVSRFTEESNTVFVTVLSAAVAADLSVMKTPSVDTVDPGDTLTYTIVVENLGPETAENVVLTDNIPASILNPEYSIDGGSTFLPWEGSLNLGNMLPNQIVTVIIDGTVAEDASSPIRNTATVSSDTFDPNQNNNTSIAVVNVTREVTERCQALIDVVQSAALQEAAISHLMNAEGEKIQRIVELFDDGNATAEDVIAVNDSFTQLLDALNMLELAIQSKLKLLGNGLEECGV